MKNTFTEGSEYAHRRGRPANEDYSIVVEVIADNGTIIIGRKLWDSDPGKIFYAMNLAGGNQAEPGSYVVFRRVGDFAGQVAGGFELHTEDAGKVSWVCLEIAKIIEPVEVSMMWMYDVSANVWVETVYQNAGPGQRHGASIWVDSSSRFYVMGGINLAGEIYSDLWKGTILASGTQITWTQLADPPFTANAYCGVKTDNGANAWILGGYDSGKNKTVRFWRYTISTAAWTQLANCPVPTMRASMTPGRRVLLPYGVGGSYYTGLIIVNPINTAVLQFYKTSVNAWDTPYVHTAYVPTSVDDYMAFANHGSFSTSTSTNSQHVGGKIGGVASKQVFTLYVTNGYVRYLANTDFSETICESAVARGYSDPAAWLFGGKIGGVVDNRLFKMTGYPGIYAEFFPLWQAARGQARTLADKRGS